MSELRQDPTTYDWVIIAKERAKRPHEFSKKKTADKATPNYNVNCPFCPGNEHLTPPAEALYGSADKWNIRVIPNKFAALAPDGNTRREEWRLFRKSHGYGKHEVVIETPIHNQFIPFMSDEHVEELIQTYKDRYHALKKDCNIKVIIIFKNHGAGAGT